jgi:Secretion system C-terminal sorting domain
MPRLMSRRLFVPLSLLVSAFCSFFIHPSLVLATTSHATGQAAGGAPQGFVVPAPVLSPPTCNGSRLVLTPGTPPFASNSTSVNLERGEFITALQDFHICSMGIHLELAGSPQTLNAYIYAASNATRGALLASASVSVSGSGPQVFFVPIDYTLKACQEYELVFLVPANDNWERWDVKNTTKIPFNVQGAITLRWVGGAGGFGFPHIELVGTPGAAPHTSDFAGPNGTAPAYDANQERGLYVNMRDTSRLSSIGFEADLVAGQVLTATVYNATGTTRNGAIATGTYVVPSAGMQWHDVPINALLVEGNHYDLAIQFGGTNSWNYWVEGSFPEPFTRDVFDVLDAELGGIAGNSSMPHLRAKWTDHTAGTGFDLAKPNDLPLSTNQASGGYGAWITPLADQSIFAVSWEGDVPAGQAITATLYFGSGTTRDGVATTGSIVSGAAGMRWHEIPLSFPVSAGGTYDVNISYSSATQWDYWDDRYGLPYSSYGLFQVLDGERNGDINNYALIHLRIHSCNPTLTAVSNEPLHTPMFLATPAPNPAGSITRVDFSLETSGPVSLRVYDVAGRLVSTVLEETRAKGWSSVQIDSKRLASGVYFLKLQSPTASVTRKFVVLR